jgi:hypothetical protein
MPQSRRRGVKLGHCPLRGVAQGRRWKRPRRLTPQAHAVANVPGQGQDGGGAAEQDRQLTAACGWLPLNLTETSFEIPGSCMVTP